MRGDGRRAQLLLRRAAQYAPRAAFVFVNTFALDRFEVGDNTFALDPSEEIEPTATASNGWPVITACP